MSRVLAGVSALMLWGGLGCRSLDAPRVAPPAEDPSLGWSIRLGEVVGEDGRVDYQALHEDMTALDAFVAWIAEPSSLRAGAFGAYGHAFWLNAFNALSLWALAREGPPDTVDALRGWLPFAASGLYHTRSFRVAGQQVSLSEIAEERLRYRIMDYRDLAVLHTGTLDGPPIPATLLSGPGLGVQLDAAFARWIAHPERGVRVEDGILVVPPRLAERQDELRLFTSGLTMCALVSRHAEGPLAAAAAQIDAAGCAWRSGPARREIDARMR